MSGAQRNLAAATVAQTGTVAARCTEDGKCVATGTACGQPLGGQPDIDDDGTYNGLPNNQDDSGTYNGLPSGGQTPGTPSGIGDGINNAFEGVQFSDLDMGTPLSDQDVADMMGTGWLNDIANTRPETWQGLSPEDQNFFRGSNTRLNPPPPPSNWVFSDESWFGQDWRAPEPSMEWLEQRVSSLRQSLGLPPSPFIPSTSFVPRPTYAPPEPPSNFVQQAWEQAKASAAAAAQSARAAAEAAWQGMLKSLGISTAPSTQLDQLADQAFFDGFGNQLPGGFGDLGGAIGDPVTGRTQALPDPSEQLEELADIALPDAPGIVVDYDTPFPALGTPIADGAGSSIMDLLTDPAYQPYVSSSELPFGLAGTVGIDYGCSPIAVCAVAFLDADDYSHLMASAWAAQNYNASPLGFNVVQPELGNISSIADTGFGPFGRQEFQVAAIDPSTFDPSVMSDAQTGFGLEDSEGPDPTGPSRNVTATIYYPGGCKVGVDPGCSPGIEGPKVGSRNNPISRETPVVAAGPNSGLKFGDIVKLTNPQTGESRYAIVGDVCPSCGRGIDLPAGFANELGINDGRPIIQMQSVSSGNSWDSGLAQVQAWNRSGQSIYSANSAPPGGNSGFSSGSFSLPPGATQQAMNDFGTLEPGMAPRPSVAQGTGFENSPELPSQSYVSRIVQAGSNVFDAFGSQAVTAVQAGWAALKSISSDMYAWATGGSPETVFIETGSIGQQGTGFEGSPELPSRSWAARAQEAVSDWGQYVRDTVARGGNWVFSFGSDGGVTAEPLTSDSPGTVPVDPGGTDIPSPRIESPAQSADYVRYNPQLDDEPGLSFERYPEDGIPPGGFGQSDYQYPDDHDVANVQPNRLGTEYVPPVYPDNDAGYAFPYDGVNDEPSTRPGQAAANAAQVPIGGSSESDADFAAREWEGFGSESVEDIAARAEAEARQAQERLKTSESLSQRILEANKDLQRALDAQGRANSIEEAKAALAKVDVSELRKIAANPLLSPGERAEVLRQISEIEKASTQIAARLDNPIYYGALTNEAAYRNALKDLAGKQESAARRAITLAENVVSRTERDAGIAINIAQGLRTTEVQITTASTRSVSVLDFGESSVLSRTSVGWNSEWDNWGFSYTGTQSAGSPVSSTASLPPVPTANPSRGTIAGSPISNPSLNPPPVSPLSGQSLPPWDPNAFDPVGWERQNFSPLSVLPSRGSGGNDVSYGIGSGINTALGAGNWLGALGGLGSVLQGLGSYLGGSENNQQGITPTVPPPPITVTPPPPPSTGTTTPAQQPSVVLVANPNAIAVGATSRLTWTALRATECVVRYQNGNVLASGGMQGNATTPSLSQTTTFVITCGGSGGTRDASTTVYVGEQPPASAGQTSQPAPTISTPTTGTGGATAGSPPASSSPQDSNWCDPGLDIDVFIYCLENLPGYANPIQ
ncbi:MAG TPA: hypothetical protein VNM40_02425 [Candidatus Paceibacterota bacterium]|nr:hypothetical protein [Candidatus Paceibacterota bacterium]